MDALTSSLGKRLTCKTASPPRRPDSGEPVDVFTPSDAPIDARSLEPTSPFKRWGVIGIGAMATMALTSLATASTGPLPVEPVQLQPAVETVVESFTVVEGLPDLARDPIVVIAETEPVQHSYGQKLNEEQKQAVRRMVDDLAAEGFTVQADDVINFMATETAGTFDPAIRAGGQRNGAVGLAQFTQTAITEMNRTRPAEDRLTKARLAELTFTEQSEVVTEYLSSTLRARGMEGKEVSAADLYAAVFAPVAVGKPMSATIYSTSGSARYYRANRSLDTNRDGNISKSELTSRLNEWAELGETLRG